MCSLSLVFGMVMIAIFWYKPLTEALDDVTIGSADACEAIKSVLIRLTGLVEDLTSEEKHSNESKLL